MNHTAIIDRQRCRELLFDLPPRFAGLHDRRLGGRVAAEWARHGVDRGLPVASTLRSALAAGVRNLVWLDGRDDIVHVRDIGAGLAATFGLKPGPLSPDTAFTRALGDAFLKTFVDTAPVPFEGGYSRHVGDLATLLTRGVVVPLAGDAAARTACAVVTWTEMLPPLDHDRLRRELWSALAAAPRRCATPPSSAMW